MTHQDPARRGELAAIHVAAEQLALAEDSYRAIITRVSGGRTESSAGLTGPERRTLIDEFRRLGFARADGKPAKPAPDMRPQARKARALWLSLWNLGFVHDSSERALGAFLKRHSGLDALRFASSFELGRVVEHLKRWCVRVGYDAEPFHAALQCPLEASFKPGLIAAQWQRLVALGAFRHGELARLDTWLRGRGYAVSAPQFLTDAAADQVIATLGAWVRRLAAANGTPEDDGC